ncbi:MAG: hypothetical protein ACLQPH_05540 [Acidimicrobiales bacterium]
MQRLSGADASFGYGETPSSQMYAGTPSMLDPLAAPGASLDLGERYVFFADRLVDYRHPHRLAIGQGLQPQTSLDKVALHTKLDLDSRKAGLSGAQGS